MKLTRSILVLALTFMVLGAPAFAQFDLQITEVDPFGTDFADPDEPDDVEWIEVTNLGDTAWADADGILHYDDNEPNFENADPISGVTSIAPGESVIFVNHDDAFPDPSGENGIAQFLTEFPDYAGQIGSYSGSGLSSSGEDGASLWVGMPTSNDEIVSTLVFPAASQVEGQTYSPAGWGAPTPGSVVPEPAAGLMAVFGMVGLLAIRRR